MPETVVDKHLLCVLHEVPLPNTFQRSPPTGNPVRSKHIKWNNALAQWYTVPNLADSRRAILTKCRRTYDITTSSYLLAVEACLWDWNLQVFIEF